MMTFEQLYQDYFEDVHRFALWLARDRYEAEDLVSETFVRAWGRRHRLRTETLRAYLLAIARSVFLDQRRKARASVELSEEWPDGAPGPHRQATARMDLDCLRRAVARMPEADRTALILRTEHDLPYAEVARVLEISEGAARVKVHRARRKLVEAYLAQDKEKRDGSDP